MLNEATGKIERRLKNLVVDDPWKKIPLPHCAGIYYFRGQLWRCKKGKWQTTSLERTLIKHGQTDLAQSLDEIAVAYTRAKLRELQAA